VWEWREGPWDRLRDGGGGLVTGVRLKWDVQEENRIEAGLGCFWAGGSQVCWEALPVGAGPVTGPEVVLYRDVGSTRP